MEKCARCGKKENEIRLFDGFYVNDMAKICERCSLIAGIPIIKRPSVEQLKDAEKPYGVRVRLARMAHLNEGLKKDKPVIEQLRDLDNQPELEQPSPDELVFKMVDNFHWVIQTARRRKGITAKQLADSLGQSEEAIKLLEKKIVPGNSMDLIRGIEQILGIILIKRDFFENKPELEIAPVKTEEKKQNQESLNFRKEVSETIKMHELHRLSEKIDEDFEFKNKTWEQVGEEQTEKIGRENKTYPIKTTARDGLKKRGNVPTIYDLMKKKEEKDKVSVVGKDIEIVEDKKPDNWADLE